MNTVDGENKIKEQFHYFNIHAGVDSVYGNWAVSTKGDVVNSVYPFAVMSIHIVDTDWLEIIKNKSWFRPEYEESFIRALSRAQILVVNKWK